jgi:uncharacterized membrane protein
MRCGKCGVEMVAGAAFCPSCGKAAGQSLVATESASPLPAVTGPGLQPNIAGLLCYVVGFLTGIYFLVADPYKRDPFVRFHALQSIFLSIVWFAVYFAIGMLTAIMPYTFWQVAWMLHSLLGLAFFLLWVFLMYKAYNHEQFKLPFIGDLAAKQA